MEETRGADAGFPGKRTASFSRRVGARVMRQVRRRMMKSEGAWDAGATMDPRASASRDTEAERRPR
jgi:hypothetical protein